MKKLLIVPFILFSTFILGQQTVFERSNGKETPTYFEVIRFYEDLAKKTDEITILTEGETDAGYPLHLILIGTNKKSLESDLKNNTKAVILINNGIHPGEPDGIDASMMLARDIVDKKVQLPPNIVLAIIPVYNIGGALNRNSFSRVNQQGPDSYGFRGNAQNLDLNRDFTKCDSKNARSFTKLFHFLDPDVLVDTHVSDGADYQHTMTLITSQYDKLGEELGSWVKNIFEPSLFKGMKEKKWNMVHYVNVEDKDPSHGFSMFYDSPRYSTGYAALFNTIGFMPETHMLKPYKDRVASTYDFLLTIIQETSRNAQQLIAKRHMAIAETVSTNKFPLNWNLDTTSFTMIPFMGFEAGFKQSKATGLPVLFYDHTKPFSREVRFFDKYVPENIVSRPVAYVIPQGWWTVIDLLKLNNVEMSRLEKDSLIEVKTYHIDSLKSFPKAYEKHHKNYSVSVSKKEETIQFLKGDYIINTDQPANTYLIEMLEPEGDDSFFAWNFFDAILQQKEGYSDYRWNEIAEGFLEKNPELKGKLMEKKKADNSFANNSSAQLNYIYKSSPYYEPAHNRYPVYRIEKSLQ